MIDAVHAIAVARIGADAPRPGGPQANEQTRRHADYYASFSANAPSLASACTAARSAPEASSASAPPEE